MFREDLFYRLNVVTIHIPPLRERREEIPVFLDFFLRKYSEFYGKQPAPFQRLRRRPHDGVQLAGQHSRTGEPGQALRHCGQRSRRSSASSPPTSRSSPPSAGDSSIWGIKQQKPRTAPAHAPPARVSAMLRLTATVTPAKEMPSLLEIGRRAAMQAEREAIERVWRRPAGTAARPPRS